MKKFSGVYLILAVLIFFPLLTFALQPQGDTTPPAQKGTTPDTAIIITVLVLMTLIVLGTIISFIYLQRKLLEKCQSMECLREYFQLPFGVPQGTVRSVITFLVIAIGLLMITLKVFYASQVDFPETLGNIIMAVIAFYFGTRAGSKLQVPATAVQPAAPSPTTAPTETEKNEAQQLIERARQILNAAETAKKILPAKEREKLEELIKTARKYLDEAEKAAREGKLEVVKNTVELIQKLLAQKEPVHETIEEATSVISSIVGLTPAPAIVGKIIEVGGKLASAAYQKWQKRILDIPITIGDVNPNLLDPDTAQRVFISIDLFKRSFEKELLSSSPQDKNKLLTILKDFLGTEDVDALWKKYEKQVKGTREEFEKSLELVREALVDFELSGELAGEDWGDLQNYQTFMSYLERIKDDKKGQSILTRLMDLVGSIREKKIPIQEILALIKM